jgi:N-acetylglucosamine-6-phosphate deacetylase
MIDEKALALVNGRIVTPAGIVTGRAVMVDAGKIAGIVDEVALPLGIERLDVGGRYIAPGFIDLHIHGALGYSFNDPFAEAYAAITGVCARHGVTGLLATIATAAVDDMLESLAYCRSWMAKARPGARMLGVHLEGPYINPAQAGALDPTHIRRPDDGTADRFLAYADVLRIVVLAPELPGATDLIARLAALGILPAAGHSVARDTDVLAAMRAGLRHVTHIWSAMSSTVREGPWRKPGLLEAALTFEGLTVEMIADGKHLPPTLMKLAHKCVGPGRLCVISDASSGAGLAEGAHFRMGDMTYEVRDGVGMLFDRTAFAGSTTLAGQMLPVLVEQVGLSLVDAVQMLTLTPARAIGVDGRMGSLDEGKQADIVIFGDDYRVWATLIGGAWAYRVGEEEKHE